MLSSILRVITFSALKKNWNITKNKIKKLNLNTRSSNGITLQKIQLDQMV